MQLSVALQGVMTQQLLPDRRRLGPRRGLRGARARRRPCATSSARARPTRSTRRMQTGSSVGMQTMDAALADARARRQDHPARSPRRARRRPRSCAACSAAGGARRGRLSAMAHLRLQGDGPHRGEGHRRGRGRVQAGRRRPAQGARADRPRHRGQARLARRSSSTSCKRVKPTDLTIMTRQLATMVSSGMTILRALYVLEAQTENKLLAETHRRRPQGRRGRPAAQRRARAPPQGLHRRSSSR